ncbi:MAG: hypothetical protein JXB35_08700 [Anaerolineae bacterium]|nr:hypothetical protein [Anaerolineae bacterium]
MTILDRFIDQVAGNAAQARVQDIRIGAYWTAVSVMTPGGERAGIASTLHGGSDDHHHGGAMPVRAAGWLLDSSVVDLAALAYSRSLLEASVGLATINALLDVDMDRCIDVNAADIIAERGAGKRVAIVGHFPFTPQIRAIATETWVLELNPRDGDVPAVHAPELIPQADVVALTGTALLNHTFDDLVSLCREDAYVVVLGGTTPLSERFFATGVHAVAGTRIVAAGAALRSVSQGATFKQIRGKQLLTLFCE